MNNLFKKLPSVDEILRENDIIKLLENYKHDYVVKIIRQVLSDYRDKISHNIEVTINKQEIVKRILEYLSKNTHCNLKRVINATGVVIHTNLGRSIFPDELIKNLWEVTAHYSTLEYNIENGKRGSRYSLVEKLLCEVTGAEAALVVNNNAAAVLLSLSVMSKGKEVIVSRGQLVEIGGSFRIPDVMLQSGAILKEVGTTNKTHDYDYTNAINENTGLILKVHTSNFRLIGFTEEVSTEKLVEISEKYNIPIMEDLGSGVLVDLRKYGLPYEPTVQEVVKAGMDIVTFSGDKLLGGPQAGIIVGKKSFIDLMKKHPLTRAVRVDKMCLSTLEYILRIYLYNEPEKIIPTLKMLTLNKDILYERAVKLKDILSNINKVKTDIIEISSMAGGGALAEQDIPSYGIKIEIDNLSSNDIENKFRTGDIPIICRIVSDAVILDVRTLLEDDYDIIFKSVKKITEG
ncbi:L-seryl-tRNA(Sec) selenium transferase [Aceticella autotrophica]|uniref:L-seryl-tRNA(Sec) selenium transferase n=1 Tax=Aceticella autotrophica TaxID=2755338 RepID=A0A975AUS7_9THEO|nr:L-seryl-tRNA(Sec) selenium transferase [Aceticella autotrophica]QSZ26837.1 L-seryl-tRNA(Sec) selenium transferase [Aceticella autotrophica]